MKNYKKDCPLNIMQAVNFNSQVLSLIFIIILNCGLIVKTNDIFRETMKDFNFTVCLLLVYFSVA